MFWSKPGRTEAWRGVESLRDLVRAHLEKRDETSLRAAFEQANGRIVNAWFGEKNPACVVVTDCGTRWRRRRQVLVLIGNRPAAMLAPEFDDAIWRAIWLTRLTEPGSERALTRTSRPVVANLLFTVLVFLLGTLDHVCATCAGDAPADTKLLQTAAEAARGRLDNVEAFLAGSEQRATVRGYLLGLPLGITVLAAIGVLLADPAADPAAIRNLMALAGAAGGLGAVASVMLRVTRGQHLDVDVQQGIAVTVAGGAFRPLIGAVFGVALLVLAKVGMLPLRVAGAEDVALFFGGLAFLAGFSERWAQDTILRSIPLTPQGTTIASSGSVLVAPPDRTALASDPRREQPPGPG